MPLRGEFFLMSLRGIRKSIQTSQAPTPGPTPRLLVGRVSSWLFLDGLLSSSPPPLHQPESIMLHGKPNLGDTFSSKKFSKKTNRIAMNQETE